MPIHRDSKLKKKIVYNSSHGLILLQSVKEQIKVKYKHRMADLRICWSHIPHCWKSQVVAQMWVLIAYLEEQRLRLSLNFAAR